MKDGAYGKPVRFRLSKQGEKNVFLSGIKFVIDTLDVRFFDRIGRLRSRRD